MGAIPSENPLYDIAVYAAEIARTEGWKDQEELWRATLQQGERSAAPETDDSTQPKESQESTPF